MKDLPFGAAEKEGGDVPGTSLADPSVGLSVLLLSPELPAPTSRLTPEFLTVVELAKRCRVGLVSGTRGPADSEVARLLEREGASVFVDRSLWVKATPAGARGSPDEGHAIAPSAGPIAGAFRPLAHAVPAAPSEVKEAGWRPEAIAGPLLAATRAGSWGLCVVLGSGGANWAGSLSPETTLVLDVDEIRSRKFWSSAIAEGGPLRRLACAWEAFRWYLYELKYFKRFFLLIVRSDADKIWVERHFAVPRVAVCPVPFESAQGPGQFDVPAEPARILFLGDASDPLDAAAALRFAARILPELARQLREVAFVVPARGHGPALRALEALDNVVVNRQLDDIREELTKASIVVAPHRAPRRGREILQAWAMGKPVISTSVAAQGMEFRAGENMEIADSDGEMVSKVTALLRDEATRLRLGRAGIAAIEEDHDPERTGARYFEALKDVAAERSHLPFSVLLDLRWMVPGLAGGAEFYARSLVSALSRQDCTNRYTLLMPASSAYDFDLRGSPNFRRHVFDSFRRSAFRLLRRGVAAVSGVGRARSLDEESMQLLSVIKGYGAEIAHSFLSHISPDLEYLPSVLTVHDIQQEYMPELWSEEALRIRDQQYPSSAHRARRIIAVSEFTRRSIIEKYGVSPEKVVTIHEAPDDIFLQAVPKERLEAVRRRYDLPEGFLFYPAHTWRHKNHEGLLEALGILERRRGLRPVLVLSGSEREAHRSVLAKTSELGLGDRVRFLGFCILKDMPSLYRLAAALVYPSFFEGFGLPVLEAMASGCPVAASNRTSLPEIYGDCAEEFDPSDGEGMAEAIWRLLSDREHAAALAARGSERARGFTWREAAWKTAQVYYDVVREKRGP